MSDSPENLPPVLNPALAPVRTLRRLFLTLYLRGRSSRGLRRQNTPKSVASKFSLALIVYALFGCFAFYFFKQHVFGLAVYLHGFTFMFLGMFVSASAGEILFNKEEADILLHRPVTAGELLWSKIRVLVEVSLWLACAMNLAGFFVGYLAPDGGLLFPIVHAIATVFEALFCTSCIVIVYQLCLRWFGREKLDSLMTTTQVVGAIIFVAAGQLLPRLTLHFNGTGFLVGPRQWWLYLLPPAWFAGIDDAVVARGPASSWYLAVIGLAATALVVWLAFIKLARNYEIGLQTISEAVSRKPSRKKRRWAEKLVDAPPFKWFVRTSVSRAAFLLTAAYLIRDRDVKLRVFPGIAPMFIIPVMMLLQNEHSGENFGLALSGAFLAALPLLVIDLLQYSQQWQASDIFRVAPMQGPGELCHGARNAVFVLIMTPVLIVIGLMVFAIQRDIHQLVLFLPGIMLMPLAALFPAVFRYGIPLSLPNEEAKSAGRTLKMFGIFIPAMLISGIAMWAYSTGWIMWLLIAEAVVIVPVYFILRGIISRQKWREME